MNPGFKVVFARIDMVEEAFFRALPVATRTLAHGLGNAQDTEPVRKCGFFIDREGPDHGMNSDRTRLRRELRQRRRDITPGQRIAAAESLATQLLALPFMPASGFVAGYWAMDGEIALHVFQLRLPPSLVYCLPVLAGDQLRFAPWRPGDALATNRYGIPEPDVAATSALDAQAMSLVVLPLVGFDANGQRLGMGGGWYDRSFAARGKNARSRHPGPPWLVGAGFAAQQLDAIVTETWDVSLDAVCTERETLLIHGVPA